ncbi:MAG: TonB family protein [Bdellovibrionales bacterium]|nr:TonB family protein [Bdellovibrionales bacterium]
MGVAASNRRQWVPWAVAALLALLWHLGVMILGTEFGGWLLPDRSLTLPIPLEMNSVSPAELSRLKKQWEKRSLLSGLNPALPDAKAPVEDARYFSDRDVRVEKESRSTRQENLPRPGAAAPPATSAAQQPKPRIDQLGVALPVGRGAFRSGTQEGRARPEPAAQPRVAEPGAAQYVDDDELPQSGENLLNTKGVTFYGFFARLREGVAPLWETTMRSALDHASIPSGNYTTVAEITLDGEGDVREVSFIQSSGYAELDDVVDHTFRKLRRFPHPPREIFDPDGKLRFSVKFEVRVSGSSFSSGIRPMRRTR